MMLKFIMDMDIILMGTFILFGCLELAGLDWLAELLVKPGNELHAVSNQSSQRLQSSRTHWLVLPFTIIVSIVISLLCTFDEPHNSSSSGLQACNQWRRWRKNQSGSFAHPSFFLSSSSSLFSSGEGLEDPSATPHPHLPLLATYLCLCLNIFKIPKLYEILHRIESLNVCMKY